MSETYKIHKTNESKVNYDAESELNKELGVVSYSLWYRDEEEQTEYPLMIQSQEPVWLSHDTEFYKNSEAQDLTDHFIEGVAQLTDEDSGGGWGGVDEDVWDEMEDVEQVVYTLIRRQLVEGMPPRELVLFLDWCKEQ